MKKTRLEDIYQIIQREEKVYVEDLAKVFNTSEATIRRDLQKMEDLKLVHRFYGGATLNKEQEIEPSMNAKHLINMDEKKEIARYCASLIKDNDIIYIDAGTTTELIVDHIYAKNVLVVTQALSILNKLYERQIKCYTLGGYIKFRTNIIIDNDIIERIQKWQFNLSFIGANGIHPFFGFSTTNEIEAMLKRSVISRSEKPYIVADNSKFNQISSVSFCNARDAYIITDEPSEAIDETAYNPIIYVHK